MKVGVAEGVKKNVEDYFGVAVVMVTVPIVWNVTVNH